MSSCVGRQCDAGRSNAHGYSVGCFVLGDCKVPESAQCCPVGKYGGTFEYVGTFYVHAV